MTTSVSMRELNHRSGQIIRDVVSRQGSVEITDRNKPVARIVAITQAESPIEKLLAREILSAPPKAFSLPEGIEFFPAEMDVEFLVDREDRVQ